MYPMKKYYLLVTALVVLFSADSFAGTIGKDDHKKDAAKTTSSANDNSKKDSAINTKADANSNSSIVLSFKGSINNSTGKLHWITEDEHGMKSFTIERSTNNRDFYPIAIMPAMNEKGQLFYEYPDKDVSKLAAQKFSYRLSFRYHYRTNLTFTTNLKLKYLIEDLIQQYFSFRVCVKLF